ncbi:MAG: hypothetical protein MUC63_03565, partial [Planctomycetes bacterium]|nr:hypothetical protein [Planctomycetota bacterium]
MRTTYRKSPIAAFASVLALLLASATAFASPLADGIGGWVPAERLTGHHVLLERLEQGQADTSRGALILWTQDGRRISADAVVSVKEKRGAFAVCNLIVEEWHAYCVGNQRIVIHNGNPCAAPKAGTGFHKHHTVPREVLK